MAFDDELRDALRARAGDVNVSADARQRVGDKVTRAAARRRRQLVGRGILASVLALTAGTFGIVQLRTDPVQPVDAGAPTAPPRFVLTPPEGWVLNYVDSNFRLTPVDEGTISQIFRRDAELASVSDPSAPAVSIVALAGDAADWAVTGARSLTVRGHEGLAINQSDPAALRIDWTEGGYNITATAANLTEAELLAWLDAGTLAEGEFQPGDAEPALVETSKVHPLSDTIYSLVYYGPADLSQPADPIASLTASSAPLASEAAVGDPVEVTQLNGAEALVVSQTGEFGSGLIVAWERDGLLLTLSTTGIDADTALTLAAGVRQVDEPTWERTIASAEVDYFPPTAGMGEVVEGPSVVATLAGADFAWTLERTTHADGSTCDSFTINGNDDTRQCYAGAPTPPENLDMVALSDGRSDPSEAWSVLAAAPADVTRLVVELNDGGTFDVAAVEGSDGVRYFLVELPGYSYIQRWIAYRADASEASDEELPFGGPSAFYGDEDIRGTPVASGEPEGASWSLEAVRMPMNIGGQTDCLRLESAHEGMSLCPIGWTPPGGQHDVADQFATLTQLRDHDFLLAWSHDAKSVRVTYTDGEVMSAELGKAPDGILGFTALLVDLDKGVPHAVELVASDGTVTTSLDPLVVGFSG